LTRKRTREDIVPLGIYGKKRYILLKDSGRLLDYTPQEMQNHGTMQDILPATVWMDYFARTNKEGVQLGVDYARATEWLVNYTETGLFDPDRIRGRGAWLDAGRSVVHLGDRLLIDGNFRELEDYKGDYIYPRDKPIRLPDETEYTPEDHAVLLDAIDSFLWDSPLDKALFMGWLGVAFLCGGIDWRPHLWLVGKAGTGKSTAVVLMQKVLQAFLLPVQSTTTEAALRQMISHDAIPVTFDEAEAYGHQAEAQMQKRVELMRSASSESDAVIGRGTASQKAVTQKIRAMFFLASIGESLKYEQDKQRFVILGLKPAPRNAVVARQETYKRLNSELMPHFDAKFSSRLFLSRSRALPEVKVSGEMFTEALLPVFKNQRLARQYGILMASDWAFTHNGEATLADAREHIGMFDWGKFVQKTEESIDSTEGDALQHLFSSIIEVKPGVKKSVHECILTCYRASRGTSSVDDDAEGLVLARYGLRLVRGDKGLFIANKNQYLEKIFTDTAASGNWNGKIFGKMEGVKSDIQKPHKDLSSQRGVTMPLSYVFEEDETIEF
jgi:putative DNA primase/helicase